MKKAIYFDMDGTIADLYGVENWLSYLIKKETVPYRDARALLDLRQLARLLNRLQRKGYHLGIVSWLAKNSTAEYDEAVAETKKEWLQKHLKSVNFDEIVIVPYGTPKQKVVKYNDGILFDDEEPNRNKWTGTAYNETEILQTLRKL